MSDLPSLYSDIRAVLVGQPADLVVTKDEPGSLVIRTVATDPKGERGWFATLAQKKAEIVLHIMPLYNNAALEAVVAPCLAPRRHGKTCFNFRKRDSDQLEAIAALAASAARWVVSGKVR